MAASSVLVTGATGSAGSNVCRLAAERGMAVRGLVRPGTDVGPLERCGAVPVVGDVTQPETLDAAMDGVGLVVHCAAQIGGTWSTATPADYVAVNQQGSINVLDAAARAGVGRTVILLSAIVFDTSETLTERSRVVPIGAGDSPYVRTKRAAYYEGMARAARGAEVSFVVPGGIYGPSLYVDRALVPTIFTGTLVMAAHRELSRYLPMPISWVLAEDVAAIALLAGERGRPGARYLAMGRPDDACSLPAFCNRFLKLAGIPHTVEEFDPQKPGAADDPEFGPMVRMLRARYPDPPHDCSRTTKEFGHAPTPLATGLQVTLDWLREHDRVPVAP